MCVCVRACVRSPMRFVDKAPIPPFNHDSLAQDPFVLSVKLQVRRIRNPESGNQACSKGVQYNQTCYPPPSACHANRRG